MTDYAFDHEWETTMDLTVDQLKTMSHSDRYHRMCLLTKHKASYGHMAQAIQHNKDNRLIQAYHTVLKKNYQLNEDTLLNGDPVLPHAIYGHCHAQEIGTGRVLHHLVKYTRCSFSIATEYVEFGNCTCCYRALPMGTYCMTCSDQGYTDRRSRRIYFTTSPGTYEAPPFIRGAEQRKKCTYQLLTDTTREYCNPFELAHQLYGQEIIASLSWN